MLLCLIPSFIYSEGDSDALLTCGLSLALIGFALHWFTRSKDDLRTREAFFSVVLTWVTVSVVGGIPYVLQGLLSFSDALFESISGFTTTGASVVLNIEAWPHGLAFWRSLTQALGGLGIVVMSVAMLPIAGSGIESFQSDTSGPIRDKLTPRVRETAQALWGIYVGLILIESIALMLGGVGLFDAICHSFSSVATGGFSTRTAGIGAFNSSYVAVVVILFMLAGGANFGWHFRLVQRRPLTLLQDREFRLWVLIMVAAVVLMAIVHNPAGDGGFFIDLKETVFAVVSATTTTGLLEADPGTWEPPAKFVLLVLLFIGSCAGSTSGSIKTFRWLVTFKTIRLQLRRNLHPQAVIPLRIGGRIIPDDTVRGVLVFIISYFAVVFIGAALLIFSGQGMLVSFASSAACAAGCGSGIFGLGAAGTYAGLSVFAKSVLIGVMFIGRLEIFSLLVIFTRGFWRP